MFTENELDALLSFEEVKEKTQSLKESFIQEEVAYLEISDHDFLSLIVLSPSVGIALANGSVSLFEEISLNKKARKLSKGGYWMKKDPVVIAMSYLIKHYEVWSDRFFAHIRFIMSVTMDRTELLKSKVDQPGVTDEEFCLEGLRAPFVFIRFLTSFFLDDEDEDIISHRNISKIEHARVMEIAKKLEFDEIPLFRKFATKLIIRK